MTEHEPLPVPTNKRELAEQLRLLAEHATDIGTSIDYFGGTAEWAKHGTQLVGAATIMYEWADEIEGIHHASSSCPPQS